MRPMHDTRRDETSLLGSPEEHELHAPGDLALRQAVPMDCDTQARFEPIIGGAVLSALAKCGS